MLALINDFIHFFLLIMCYQTNILTSILWDSWMEGRDEQLAQPTIFHVLSLWWKESAVVPLLPFLSSFQYIFNSRRMVKFAPIETTEPLTIKEKQRIADTTLHRTKWNNWLKLLVKCYILEWRISCNKGHKIIHPSNSECKST